MRTFLLGYNVESCDRTRPGAVERFLRAAPALHREMDVPCTFFVKGKALEQHPDAFKRARDESDGLIDFQQHTYAGLPLKTVCQENHEGIRVFRGLTPEQCRDSLSRTADLMEQILGVRPVGLSAPLGHYRGLADRPAILEVLHECGIRFVRSWTRNAHDWSPLAFEVQPFTYDRQGFPEIMEIPGQGWPDYLLREALGMADAEKYVQHVRKDLDYVAAKELVWSYVQHDGSSIADDPGMAATRTLLHHARQLGFAFKTHRAYYEEIAGPIAAVVNNAATPVEPDGLTFVRGVRRIVGEDAAADEIRGRERSWRTRRTWLRARIVRKRRKPELRKLMKKAGSPVQRKLIIAMSRQHP